MCAGVSILEEVSHLLPLCGRSAQQCEASRVQVSLSVCEFNQDRIGGSLISTAAGNWMNRFNKFKCVLFDLDLLGVSFQTNPLTSECNNIICFTMTDVHFQTSFAYGYSKTIRTS